MGLFDNLFKKRNNNEKINISGIEIEINAEAKVFTKEGLDAYINNKYSEAVSYFTKAINAQLSNHYLYTCRGNAHKKMHIDKEAEKDF